MDESILTTVKRLLGILEVYEVFDSELIIHINTVFSILNHIGVGPTEGFKITGKTETWSEFIGDSKLLEDVKTYIYLKVRLIWDPPINGSVISSMKEIISELEWRMNAVSDIEKEDTK